VENRYHKLISFLLQVKWVPAKEGAKLTGVGLVYFDTMSESAEALVLANHVQVTRTNYALFCRSLSWNSLTIIES
jgi:hypothetical protein